MSIDEIIDGIKEKIDENGAVAIGVFGLLTYAAVKIVEIHNGNSKGE